MRPISIIISCILLLTLSTVHAEENKHSINDLQHVVERALLAKIGPNSLGPVKVQLGRFDPRLRLAACPRHELEIFLPNPNIRPEQARIVGVRCNSPQWSLYIPVSVRIEAKVVVAKLHLPRGTQLTENALLMATMDVTRLQNGYFQSKAELINQVVKQPIASGQAITPQQIQLAEVIRRGEMVQIRVKTGGLVVSMQGEALAPGGLGDVIHVRNLTSKRVLDGKVVASSTVEVTP